MGRKRASFGRKCEYPRCDGVERHTRVEQVEEGAFVREEDCEYLLVEARRCPRSTPAKSN